MLDPKFRWSHHETLPPYRGSRVFGLFMKAMDLPGDMAELGCFKGETTVQFLRFIAKHRLEKTVHAFDTFDGIPALEAHEDKSTIGTKRGWNFSPRTEFEKTVKDQGRFQVYEGLFSDFIGKLKEPLCFAYIDADLYQSTKDAILLVQDLIVPEGVILFDDYGADLWWPGVKKAVDEMHDPERFKMESDDKDGMWQAWWRRK